MKELRVALFTGNYNHIKDGVSLTLNRWVKFLEEKGIPVLVFGPTTDYPEVDHYGELVKLPSFPLPVSNRSEYRVTMGISVKAERRLKKFNPTLLHIATPDISGLKALKWAKQNRVQVVASYHTHFTSYFNYYGFNSIEFLAWRYLSWFYNSCTHVYVPSQSMVEELKSHEFKNHMKIWARGVNTSLFAPAKRDEEWRKQVGFNKKDIVVTFVSRLVWEKELDTYRQSVQQVASGNSNVKAMIVGDGPARKKMEQIMPEAHYTGFLNGEDLAKAYASSDVFFFPSHTETFGNVTLEAMSSGLPCLVADATGSKSLVKGGVNGYLAKPGNVKEFTNKLQMITSDQNKRKVMKEASRTMALNYSWDSINEKLLKNYYKALELPAPPINY